MQHKYRLHVNLILNIIRTRETLYDIMEDNVFPAKKGAKRSPLYYYPLSKVTYKSSRNKQTQKCPKY